MRITCPASVAGVVALGFGFSLSAGDADKLRNSIAMELVKIPAGSFLMGSPKSERGRYDDETQHEVKITKPFYLGVHEVTQVQYEKIMGANPSHFCAKGQGKERVQERATSRFPVENVTW